MAVKMSTLPEILHAVWLYDRRVGTIHQRGDYTRFALDDDYRTDPNRFVLGLQFEQNLLEPRTSALRVPPWFSNLLPEGRIREWVADDRGVSADREMELLAHLGHDLPGAVRVLPDDGSLPYDPWEPSHIIPRESQEYNRGHSGPGWRISLAGVQLKYAMLKQNDRLTVPAFGEGSDWIVKLPDRLYSRMPQNEHAMMMLAKASGLDIPDIRLVHRDELDGIPSNVWPEGEVFAYAVERFDRGLNRSLIHVEDLAQVRNFYPNDKYRGNFETVASLIYRRRDLAALREFARRLTFLVLIGNGDAHLKNWSLIYRDPRIPTLSPAYDLVATHVYREGVEDLGLKFFGSRSFERVSLQSFRQLQERLGATHADLPELAEETVTATTNAWKDVAELLGDLRPMREEIGNHIMGRAKTLLRLKE